MKKCPYCGKEYPDEATMCAIDETPLVGSLASREIMSGVWRGVYGYGKADEAAGMVPVAFTLRLKQGWLGHFTGTVTEDAPLGMPGTGIIDGYFGSPKIEFSKQMPVGYVNWRGGPRMTLREYIRAKGHPCEHEPPSSRILYQGTLLDANRMQGTWTIRAHRIPLPDGSGISFKQRSGYWCAEFATADAKANPTGGPGGPWFDRTLFSPEELKEVEGVPFRSLGKFSVTDTEKWVDRFGQEVRFELRRADDGMMSHATPITVFTGGQAGTAQMIEIFIHPDDEATVAEITAEENGTKAEG
jgi:hypothetical protein